MAHLFSNNFREEHDYLQLSQPKPSNILLTDNIYFSYEKSPCSENCFKWVQPLQWNVKNDTIRWNKLIIENNQHSDVLNHAQNSNCNECFNAENDNCFCYSEITISNPCSSDNCFNKKYKILPTDEESNIELYTDFFEKSLEVFYIAKSNFSANVELKYFKSFEDSFFEKSFNNLSKDHFLNLNNDSNYVKIAFKSYKERLKSEKDIGFFKPNRLSVGKFDYNVGQQFYDTRIAANSAITNVRECIGRVEIEKFNIFNEKSINYRPNSFQPFKSKKIHFEESKPKCRQVCKFNQDLEGIVYQYQEDVFGNRYSLYKNIFPENTIYSKNVQTGQLWIQKLTNEPIINILNEEDLLVKYKKFYFESGLYGELFNYGIVDFKIFYDTLYIKTENNFIFEKLDYDFDNSKLSSTESHYISGSCSEALLNPSTKKIAYSYINASELYLGIYDLNKPKLCGIGTNYGMCESNNGKITLFNERLNKLTVVASNNQHLDFYSFTMIGDGFEVLDRVVISDIENLESYKLIKGKLLDNGDYFLIFENSIGSIFPTIINKL